MQNNRPILTITGSDPAGASGVQADIKTITALGGYAVSAVTSVTIQNTLGIQDFYDLPAAVVEGQIEAIVNDVEPQTVKIGMIRTVEVLDVVVNLLTKYRPANVVYMPVALSAQGERLMSEELENQIRDRLLPLCTVVVSNVPTKMHGEANTLASAVACYLNEGATPDEALAKARQLLDSQTARPAGLRSRSRELYEQFVSEVEAHYRTNSDVRFYAESMNVASGYLAQVTRRIASMSPKAIIDGRIAEEAERLLTATALTVQEVAYELGFSTQAHFSKFFKKQRGVAPSVYRGKQAVMKQERANTGMN